VPEQRKSKRFELRLPLELVRNGHERISEMGETRNLSSTGVLFRAPLVVELGQHVEYLITLPASGQGADVRIRCVGKVIRQANDAEFAATLERYEFVRNGA
jgi:PilZ domain-containing protein